MGFDIECIIDIQTYPGEYFCPVCRTLVYPNEAIQSRCTHLYCKPCLTHVANSTRACPYDGYLVTEADSKPLAESDKALAENIGKVKVRCLYHRSGCTWEGTLSDCTLHCSGCAYGNSPVICNRCGIQIIHRQVHEHAQSCPGVPQAQQAVDGVQNAGSSGTAAVPTGADQKQVNAQLVPATSQGPSSLSTAAPLLPASSQPATANAQAPAAAPATVPVPDWYQQQYQQYYQQYAGYDPYQQYYPYQQQTVQPYPQQTPVVQGQQQPQVYSQPQSQPLTQSHIHAQQQPQLQQNPLAQPQAQLQSQSQPQPIPQAHSQPQSQFASQGLPQPPIPAQAVAPQQGQSQVNNQQQLHTAMQPHMQVPPQPYQPQSHAVLQPQHYPQAQNYPHPHPTQPRPMPVPQYQQPHHQMHQPVQAPQVHPQAPVQPQPQSLATSQPQHQHQHQHQHQQQTQPLLPPQNLPQTHAMRPQINQPSGPNAQPQPLHQSANAVSGHLSYLQPQPSQQMQYGPPPQHTVHPQPSSGSVPVQMHGHVSQPPPILHHSHQHGPVANQQQTLLASQAQDPAKQQLPHPHTQQPVQPIQQRPVHSVQGTTPQQFMQPQHYPVPVQNQLPQHGHFAQPVKSHVRPQGQPHVMPQNSQSYLQSQQNPATQSQYYAGRPQMSTIGAQTQHFPLPGGGFGMGAQVRPTQHGSNQPAAAANPNFVNLAAGQHQLSSDQQNSAKSERLNDEMTATQEAAKHLQKLESAETKGTISDTDFKKDQAPLEFEDKSREHEEHVKDAGGDLHDVKDGSNEHLSKRLVKDEYTEVASEPSSGGKSVEGAQDNVSKSDGLQYSSLGADKAYRLASGADGSVKNVNRDLDSQTSREASQHYGHDFPPNHYVSSNQQGSGGSLMPPPGPPPVSSQVPGYPPSQARPQGPILMHHSLKPPNDVPFGGVPVAGSAPHFRGPGQFGPPRNFELQSGAPQGQPSAPPGLVDRPDGIIGRAPLNGQAGPVHSVRPFQSEMLQNQRPGNFDGNQSAVGFRDERFNGSAGENLNPFPIEQARPVDLASRPPYGMDYDAKFHPSSGGPASRLHAPFHPVSGTYPNDRERELPIGIRHGDTRGDLGRARPEFPGQGPPFGRFNLEHLPPGSPDREFHGFPPRGPADFSAGPRGRPEFDDIRGMDKHAFIEGSRPFNLPFNPAGNAFQGSMGGERDGPRNMRSGDHLPPAPRDYSRSGDPFGQDMLPNHLRRGESLDLRNPPGDFHSGHPSFPGHAQMGDLDGAGHLPHRPHFVEPFGSNRPNAPRLGEPGFRSSYSLPGFPSDGLYTGEVDDIGKSRKWKPPSMGWCRICKIDCGTVEGLDMHSQTREHQNMALDMVRSIKQQNRKKQKTLGNHVPEEARKKRNTGFRGRSNKA